MVKQALRRGWKSKDCKTEKRRLRVQGEVRENVRRELLRRRFSEWRGWKGGGRKRGSPMLKRGRAEFSEL